jgi:hypothetical protein
MWAAAFGEGAEAGMGDIVTFQGLSVEQQEYVAGWAHNFILRFPVVGVLREATGHGGSGGSGGH